jgi:uncharacterized membrane protein (UPF0127 family)
MKYKFSFQEKKYDIDVDVCDTILKRAIGLMFKRKSKPLLFIFKKETRQPIHSFFCIPFIAIWFNKGKVVDIKKVMPWKPYIKPNKNFDSFLEIPSSSKYFFDFSSINMKRFK